MKLYGVGVFEKFFKHMQVLKLADKYNFKSFGHEKENCLKIIEPHRVKSKLVGIYDLPDVVLAAAKMNDLCYKKHGKKGGAYAIAHCQVNKENPLAFFVIVREQYTPTIIINPRIIRHTEHTIDSEEGCMSYPHSDPIIVQRFNKIEVEYQTIEEKGQLSQVLRTVNDSLSGLVSKIFQHEIDHFDGKYVYDGVN